jgi:hypothetical protein
MEFAKSPEGFAISKSDVSGSPRWFCQANTEGWKLIERNHRFTNFSVRSTKNVADYEASVLPREMESDCEDWIAKQIRSWAQASIRAKDSQLSQEFLWLNSQSFQKSDGMYVDAPIAYLWEWAVEQISPGEGLSSLTSFLLVFWDRYCGGSTFGRLQHLLCGWFFSRQKLSV